MWIIGLLFTFQGSMLLIGEYLCVEVAWRCLDYNGFYVHLGALLLGVGFIATLMGVIDDYAHHR